MCLSQLRKSIQTTLSIINKAVKQMPPQKRQLIMNRVNTSISSNYKKGEQNLQDLKKFNKDLQFNLNFIKLSNPKLDYTLQEAPQQTPETQSPNEKQQFDHKVQIQTNSGLQIERLPHEDIFDKQIETQKKAREQVEFSNWFDGNVDPEKLNKHKQLLQRQFFQGEYWKQKQAPKSIARDYLLSAFQNKKQNNTLQKKQQIPDFEPRQVQQSEQSWQKIKR